MAIEEIAAKTAPTATSTSGAGSEADQSVAVAKDSEATPANPEHDPDVAGLIDQPTRVLLRRDQLNADFRKQQGDEEEEENQDEAEYQPDEEGEAEPMKRPSAKRSPRSKAKAKATSKSKSKGKGKAAQAKAKSKSKQAVPKRKAEKDQVEKTEKKQKTGPSTFARRYEPEDASQADRYNAIKAVFMEKLADKIKCQSSFQEPFVFMFFAFQSIKYRPLQNLKTYTVPHT